MHRHPWSVTIRQRALLSVALVLALLLVHPRGAWAEASHSAQPAAPYAGQQARPIKALSEQDISDLRAGRGWGFAKPAELNGYPGPVHLLELRVQIGLRPDQIRALEAVFASMREQAVALGGEYLAAETALDEAFARHTVTPEALALLTGRAAELRGRLRAVHLAAHLETLVLLDRGQVMRYQQLRGYDGQPAHADADADVDASGHRHTH